MAPRLRSGKGFTREEVIAHQGALRAGTANTKGFQALPTELLLEIISHFPAIPLPMRPQDRCSVYPASYLEKPRILRALSQMCRSLRSVFLPYVWQRIEVFANHSDRSPAVVGRRVKRSRVNKELATELITQLEIVTIRDPTLAQYVKIVNVLLTEFSSDTVVPELVRCLALFPNLHTIQLVSTTWRVEKSVKASFKGVLFPSVRTVIFNLASSLILSSFPEARHVSIVGCSSRSATVIFDHCLGMFPKLEVLRGFEEVDYREYPLIQRMIERFPKTRKMVLDAHNHSLTPDVMKQLSEFPDLTCIEFRINAPSEAFLSSYNKKLIKMAEAILRDKPGVDGAAKWVVLKFDHTSHQISIP